MSAFLRRPLVVAGTSLAGVGGGGIYYYLHHTEPGRGVRRQAYFWSRVTPVVADYYWRVNSSSPYVKYVRTSTRSEELSTLHARHATTLFDVMLQLKGLYVKLGQVLSVSVLPVPEPYRVLFRTLQGNVPGHENFSVVREVVEAELGTPLESVFDEFCETPLGAASIGQAHLAKIGDQEVVVKVQYPDAAWQVPADIECVQGLMRICVAAGVVDESSANLSFNEFSRQFLAELNYTQEAQNLGEIYQSSLEPDSPYRRHKVIVPEPLPKLCSPKIITMAYLPGPKLEDEARRQLKSLGIDLSSLRETVSAGMDKEDDAKVAVPKPLAAQATGSPSSSWGVSILRWVGNSVGMDAILWLARVVKQLTLSSSGALALGTKFAGTVVPLPSGVEEWADSRANLYQQSQRVALTEQWIHALFDVHGYQVFQQGLFNADAHPGNILVVENGNTTDPQLGLIDFGQCKRLTLQEQADVGRLILAVADDRSDDDIAQAFRSLGIQSKNDSTVHLAKLAKIMFGPLKTYHMDHKWHREMHEEDRVTYFPTSLSLVYRTAMLLRGLSLSLQINTSIAEEWRPHAQKAIELAEAKAAQGISRAPRSDRTTQRLSGRPQESMSSSALR